MENSQAENMQKEIDQYIENLAEAVTQQQGIEFKSLKDAEEHAKKTSQEIRHLFEQSTVVLGEGLQRLSDEKTGYVGDVSKKLLANLGTPVEMVKIIEAEVRPNSDALKLFSEAVNSYYDCGDFHIEQCVLSVFLMLFPLYPQPYACYATLIWRKDGIAAAETFYSQIVDSMEDPVLDYFAADCFVKNGNHQRASELVERALNKTQNPTEEQLDLRAHLFQLQRRCNSARGNN